MTLDTFVNKYNGKFVDWDHQFGPQCYDLFIQYIQEALGMDPKPYCGWGTAKGVWNNYFNIKGAYQAFTRVVNGPYNSPPKGAIVFWGTYPFVTGWAGHVAIASDAGSMKFISFDQNYPTNSCCHYVNHSYKGVLGWWVKK